MKRKPKSPKPRLVKPKPRNAIPDFDDELPDWAQGPGSEETKEMK